MYRHGDVALTRIDGLPNGATHIFSGNEYVVAEGEVTGHCHKVVSKLNVWEFGGDRFLVIEENNANITHEEHGKHPIEPGTYKIGIQMEYDPFSEQINKVVD